MRTPNLAAKIMEAACRGVKECVRLFFVDNRLTRHEETRCCGFGQSRASQPRAFSATKQRRIQSERVAPNDVDAQAPASDRSSRSGAGPVLVSAGAPSRRRQELRSL